MPTSAAIEHYLRTGDHDPYFFDWSGDVIERERRACQDLKRALVDEVSRRAAGRRPSAEMPAIDLTSFTRVKVEPMVRGLFPKVEQDVMLRLLERSVVFLTPERVEAILLGCTWLHTAWDLANLYLGSLGADLLAEDAPRLVGLSSETTCFVSLDYFTETGRFDDFIVHEAAHVFHNCKRITVGLRETRRREWLLEIEFRKRETFAYGCEAFSRVVELCPKIKDRPAMVEEYAQTFMPDDERVDLDELVDILREAARARNGWKHILARCAPRRERRAGHPFNLGLEPLDRGRPARQAAR
ncbi:hypothetical protein [Polyangium spumosum]|uniref:Uncharacterized protein n=1 Tax=Polyangium spumosum TaxID=889282 RepID=A0A6N7Q049_9BACT|nr:hypothetical protein [Polyangium spumosum]MRG96516.1 hypothetical protein [Polyangium spumosum]